MFSSNILKLLSNGQQNTLTGTTLLLQSLQALWVRTAEAFMLAVSNLSDFLKYS